MEIVPVFEDTDSFKVGLVVFPDGSREATCTRVTTTVWREGRLPKKGKGVFLEPELTDLQRAERAEESRKVCERRARKMVRWACRTIAADHMLTLTYRENMQDKDRLKKDWKRFVRIVQARFPGWVFVAVPEVQERGAWHLHIACHGFQNVNALRKAWHSVVGEGMGNIDVQRIKQRWGTEFEKADTGRIAAYLSKYISKSFGAGDAFQKRYWPSKGVKAPERVVQWIDCETWSEAIEMTFSIAAEGCAFGVVQWCDKISKHYWCFNPGPPKCPF